MSGNPLGFAPAIALSGRTGAGKTSLGQRLSSEFNLSRASFGDYVRSVALERGESDDRATLQSLGEGLLGDLGPAEFSERVLNASGWQPGLGLVVDGVRHMGVLEALRSLLEPQRLVLVYLSVDEEMRRARLAGRYADETDLGRVDEHSTEIEVPTLASSADLILSGEEPVDSLVQAVARFLKPPV